MFKGQIMELNCKFMGSTSGTVTSEVLDLILRKQARDRRPVIGTN